MFQWLEPQLKVFFLHCIDRFRYIFNRIPGAEGYTSSQILQGTVW